MSIVQCEACYLKHRVCCLACYPHRILISALALIDWQGQFPCTGVMPPHHCYHYIHKLVVAKEVKLQFVPGKMNPANMFTKNLQKIKFTQFQNQLGLEFGAKHP